jgi:hypothetical protein
MKIEKFKGDQKSSKEIEKFEEFKMSLKGV